MPILHELTDHILRVEISRPEKRNTLDASMLDTLAECFIQAQNDDDVRAVYLHAQPQLFSAGADIEEQMKDDAAAKTAATRLFEALDNCDKPIVACVQGPAVGLAVTLLTYCDLVYCSEKALFSLPDTALGLTPRFGTSAQLMQNAGYRRVAQKILLSEPITANEAFAMNLVNGVYPEDKAHEQAFARALRLSTLSPVAIQESKKLLKSAFAATLHAQAQQEALVYDRVSQSSQAKEACAAFLEGRKPNFS